jgi:C4-type Zn-finger protein
MEIVYPPVRRKLPHESRVREVVIMLCKKCGYDERNVTLMHIGGDRQKSFPKCGVKLVRHWPFTVQMFIGCGDEAVETQFQLKNGGNRAVSGESLYQAMMTTFGGRMLLMDKKMFREARQTEGTPYSDAGSGVKKALDSVTSEVAVPPAQTISLASAVLAERTEDNPPVVVIAPPNTTALPTEWSHRGDYKGYFKDEEKVQLVVLALVTQFQVNEPFSFEDFTKVLSNEMKITLQSLAMASMVQVFTNRGYVVRLNPRKSPSRYVVTDAAVKFASTELSSQKVDGRQHRKTLPTAFVKIPASFPATPVNNLDLVDGLSHLKQEEVEYQKLIGDIKRLEEEVARVNLGELASEEKNLEGEARSLNHRLTIITGRLAEITTIRQDANAKSNQVLEIQRQPRSKELLQRHEEFQKLKRLFAGSP